MPSGKKRGYRWDKVRVAARADSLSAGVIAAVAAAVATFGLAIGLARS